MRSVTVADSPVTAAAGDFILADATGGAITVNLAASVRGNQIVVKKTDSSANTVTVVGTIDGVSNATLAYQNQGIALEGDGSGYQRVVRQSLATGIVDYPATPDARYVRQDGTGMPSSVGTGSPPSPNWLLIAWAQAAAFQLSSATRDSNGAITTASVVWSDGATGTFTTDTASAAFPGAIDAYHVTYVYGSGPTTKTITQTAVTRDASTGAVTAQPALTVT